MIRETLTEPPERLEAEPDFPPVVETRARVQRDLDQVRAWLTARRQDPSP